MGLRRGGIRPGEEVRGNGEQVGDEGAGVFAALGALACVSLRRWVRSDSSFFLIPLLLLLLLLRLLRFLHLLLLLLLSRFHLSSVINPSPPTLFFF